MANNFVITKHVATLSEKKDGETLELNHVRWNGKSEKWDLRRWGVDENGNRIAFKGVAMTDCEWAMLQKIIIE